MLKWLVTLLPTDAFAHVPHLMGKIIEPEQSTFRITRAKYDEWDGAARAAGRPENWRRSHEDREATRVAALTGRLNWDLWVFAYGSLMLDPAIHIVEIRPATPQGYHRSFCLKIEIGRGSPENPGLVAGLREGGQCQGLLFRVPASAVDRETDIMWMREIVFDGYVPAFLHLETNLGRLEARAFIADRASSRWVDLNEEATARMIATGTGIVGSNLEYLDKLHEQLSLLGFDDPAIKALHRRAHSLSDCLCQLKGNCCGIAITAAGVNSVNLRGSLPLHRDNQVMRKRE